MVEVAALAPGLAVSDVQAGPAWQSPTRGSCRLVGGSVSDDGRAGTFSCALEAPADGSSAVAMLEFAAGYPGLEVFGEPRPRSAGGQGAWARASCSHARV
jgi:hypothetical protein